MIDWMVDREQWPRTLKSEIKSTHWCKDSNESISWNRIRNYECQMKLKWSNSHTNEIKIEEKEEEESENSKIVEQLKVAKLPPKSNPRIKPPIPTLPKLLLVLNWMKSLEESVRIFCNLSRRISAFSISICVGGGKRRKWCVDKITDNQQRKKKKVRWELEF